MIEDKEKFGNKICLVSWQRIQLRQEQEDKEFQKGYVEEDKIERLFDRFNYILRRCMVSGRINLYR